MGPLFFYEVWRIHMPRRLDFSASRPGALGHEKLDADTYASWGVDFLKEDSCFTAGDDQSLALQQYSLMRDSLNATGRPILFALCGWFPWYAGLGAAVGNMWRVGLDNSNWEAVLSNIDTNANLAQYARPGAFNDPCLLISTDASGRALASERQTRAQFSMWAIMASPLLISGNIRNMTNFNLETYKNAEVISVNQDALGKQGTRLSGGPITGQAYLSDCDAENPAQRLDLGSKSNGQSNGFTTILSPAISDRSALCFMARGCQSDVLFGPCGSGVTPTCGGSHSMPHPDQLCQLDEHTSQLTSAMADRSWSGGVTGPGCMSNSIFPYLGRGLETGGCAARVWWHKSVATSSGSQGCVSPMRSERTGDAGSSSSPPECCHDKVVVGLGPVGVPLGYGGTKAKVLRLRVVRKGACHQ